MTTLIGGSMLFPNYYLVRKNQVNDFNTLWEHLGFQTQTTPEETFNVRADLIEEKERFVLSMEIPGIKEEDINLEYKDGVLTISGERKLMKKADEGEQDVRTHFQELNYGKFKRSFRLGDSISDENITATLEQGVLAINIPKRAEKKSKIITISKDKVGAH